jgi:hypothetical protein
VVQFRISGEILPESFADPDGDFPQINAGDQFTGFIRYDADTPDIAGGSDPFFGTYEIAPGFVPFSFTTAGLTFEADSSSLFPLTASVANDYDDFIAVYDLVSLLDQDPVPPEGFMGIPIELGFSFYSTDTSVLSDLSLPREFDLAAWEEAIVFFGAESSQTGQWVEFVGRIDELEPEPYAPELHAGDANRDLEFDQLDLVQVQQRALYLTGQAATWGDGDWDGAPGGSPGQPPAGNGLFDQLDVVAAAQGAKYLTGPYAALVSGGQADDGQTSVVYDPSTGQVWVDPPAGVELTSINIDSASGIFTGEPAQNLGGSFDNDTDNNVFKATFGSSFGALTFGNVAQAGLDEQLLLADLTVVGSLAGGGALGEVDLIYVPEPSSILLVAMALMGAAGFRGRRRRAGGGHG